MIKADIVRFSCWASTTVDIGSLVFNLYAVIKCPFSKLWKYYWTLLILGISIKLLSVMSVMTTRKLILSSHLCISMQNSSVSTSKLTNLCSEYYCTFCVNNEMDNNNPKF